MAIAGNILGEATPPAGNSFNEATRGMATLAQLALPYAHRFQSLLEAAPCEDVPLVRFMVDHELSVSRIAERESQGESAFSSELIVKLAHPFAYRAADECL